MDMGAYLAGALVAIAPAPADRAGDLEKRGRYSEAEPLRRTAYEQARRRGADGLPVADSAEKLADNLAMQIRLADAEPLYRLALEIRLKRRGEKHVETARSLRQLSALLLNKGALAEAERVARHALAIQRQLSPPGDVELAWAMNSLAQVLAASGQPFEASLLYTDAVAIARTAQPADADALAVLLNNLGTNYYRMAVAVDMPVAFRRSAGKSRAVVTPVEGQVEVTRTDRLDFLRDGQAALLEALKLAIAASGENHPDTANLLNGLAANYLASGNREEAIRLYRRASTIKAQFLLPEDRDRIVGAWSLGAVLAQMPGRGAEARTQLRAAADGALAAQGRYREYDRAASAELRSYAPVFIGQVRVAWRLDRERPPAP